MAGGVRLDVQEGMAMTAPDNRGRGVRILPTKGGEGKKNKLTLSEQEALP